MTRHCFTDFDYLQGETLASAATWCNHLNENVCYYSNCVIEARGHFSHIYTHIIMLLVSSISEVELQLKISKKRVQITKCCRFPCKRVSPGGAVFWSVLYKRETTDNVNQFDYRDQYVIYHFSPVGGKSGNMGNRSEPPIFQLI